MDSASTGASLAINGITFMGLMTAFWCLLRMRTFRRFYSPKRYQAPGKRLQPKRLPRDPLGWIRVVFRYTEDEIVETAGHDALAFLRIFEFGLRLLPWLGFWGIFVVLPTNIVGNRVDQLLQAQRTNSTRGLDEFQHVEITDFEEQEVSKYVFSSFDRMSMSNVEPGSSKLWVHCISVWFVSITTLRLLFLFHIKSVASRIEFLATAERGAESHTVLVTDIPGVRFGDPLDRLAHLEIYKYLPARVRTRVEGYLEEVFSIAKSGLDVGIGVGNELTAGLKSTYAHLRNAGGLRGSWAQKLRRKRLRFGKTREAQGIEIADDAFFDAREQWPAINRRPSAKDVTDMAPQKWAKAQLGAGINLKQIIETQFREVYPEGLVESVTVVNNTSDLEPLVKQFLKTKRDLEDLLDHYSRKLKRMQRIKRKTVRLIPVPPGWVYDRYGAKPVSVDELEYLILKLENLRERVNSAQHRAIETVVPTAFVTFTTRWAQVVSSTSMHHHFETVWRTEGAPSPNEVVWENLKWRGWERSVRRTFVWSAFFLLVAFFMVPITLVQAILQIERLENIPVIGDILNNWFINAVMTGIFPSSLLALFLHYLPKLLTVMVHAEGWVSESQIDGEVARKYFIFQVITIFFFSFIAGTAFNQLDQFRKKPTALFNLLGAAAPQTATFFILYISFNAFVAGPLTFLRVPNLLVFWTFSKIPGNIRAKERLWQEQSIQYGAEVPNHTMVILLALVFATVNPIILLVALVYMLTHTGMWRYQALYTFTGEYEGGGKLWSQVCILRTPYSDPLAGYEHFVVCESVQAATRSQQTCTNCFASSASAKIFLFCLVGRVAKHNPRSGYLHLLLLLATIPGRMRS